MTDPKPLPPSRAILNAHSLPRWAAVVVSLGLLHACGGGGSTGSASTAALTAGTVTGFGSVVVDGTEIEDAQARVVRENPDGSLSNDVLQLGQRVRVAHDARKVASQVTVDAALVGQASDINTGESTLKVAAQSVSVNTDPSKGPVTVFGGGYTDLASIAAGDLVEIHGTPVYNSANNAYAVQATRIAKTDSVARVKISGKISSYALTATGASFTLNGLNVQTSASTTVRPANTALADGLQLTAFSASTLSGTVLTASHIRVDRKQDSGNTATTAQLSGVVSGYDAVQGRLVINDTLVSLGSATVTDMGGRAATVQNGAYVMLSGSVASDGSITATSIKVRTADTTAALAPVMLIGPITDFVDAQSFVVRGVPVDASNITWASACPGVTAANDVLVRVQARQQADTNVVQVLSLSCSPSSVMQVIRSQAGTTSQVSLDAKTFTLTLDDGATRSVQWNEATTFMGLVAPTTSSDTVGGKSVHIDGYLSGSILVAKVIYLDDEPRAWLKPDGDLFRKPRANVNADAARAAWTDYRSKGPRR